MPLDAASPPVARPHGSQMESDGFEPQELDGPWDPHLRVAGLVLPSAWVALTALVWWAWRLLAIHARGEFETASMASLALARGLFVDLIVLYAVFAAVRAVTRLSSPYLDTRTKGSHLAANVAMVLLSVSCLARIIDVVHGAVEKVPPTAAFWQRLLVDPAEYLFDNAALAAVLVSVVVAALVRYFVACDLETAQTVSGPMPPRTATGLLFGVAAGAAALAALVLVLDVVTERPPNDWGRVPEVQMLQSLGQAADRQALTATPELDL